MQDAFESPLPAPQKEPAGIFRHPAVIALTTLFGVAALYGQSCRLALPSRLTPRSCSLEISP